MAAAEIRRQVDSSRETSKELVASVSQLLSTVTRLAGVVTLPQTQKASITQIEFVGLSENRVLVVLVFDDREVQNRIIQLERHYSSDELKRAANYLNEQFRGTHSVAGAPGHPHAVARSACASEQSHAGCDLGRAACL